MKQLLIIHVDTHLTEKVHQALLTQVNEYLRALDEPPLVLLLQKDLTATMHYCDGSPPWWAHSWPAIVQDQDGNWYGVRAGWRMTTQRLGFKGEVMNLLRTDGEFLMAGNRNPDWKNSLRQRPAPHAYKCRSAVCGAVVTQPVVDGTCPFCNDRVDPL